MLYLFYQYSEGGYSDETIKENNSKSCYGTPVSSHTCPFNECNSSGRFRRKSDRIKSGLHKRPNTTYMEKSIQSQKYEIYRSTNGKKYKKVKTVKGLSWQDTKKGELWYKVRAVNGRQKGKFSSTVSVYTIGGRISLRQTGNSFLSAGTSVFALEIWNYASKKPAFIGCSNNGRKMTDFPIYVYNKNTRRYEKSLTNEAYYHGALSSAAGETDLKTSILHKGKGNYIIYVAGLGMIYPYVNAYDNPNIYTYYINTYFKIGSRKYRLRLSSNSSYYKDYQVQRIR